MIEYGRATDALRQEPLIFSWPSRQEWTQLRQRGVVRKPVGDVAWAKELRRRARIESEHPEWFW
jgi:hypothetical protein